MTVKIFLSVATLTFLLMGCATQQQIETVNHRLDALENGHTAPALNTTDSKQNEQNYCYIADQQYSKGAVVDGKVCGSDSRSGPDEPEDLYWYPVKR